MADLVVDTHAIIWHFTAPQNLSATAATALRAAEANGTIHVSAVTLVELIYLTEKGKIPVDVLHLLRAALDDPTSAFRLGAITRAIADAVAIIPRPTVPDMPDRIIAATALALGLPLISADAEIRKLTNITIIW